MLVFVALKTFLQLVVHVNLAMYLRKAEPVGHSAPGTRQSLTELLM